jgi:peptide deformylase
LTVDAEFGYYAGMLDIITLGDEVLHEKAQPIQEFGSEIALLADAMFEAMESDNGIGLAGPQIGVLKRIFVTDTPEDQPRVFINPEIVETSFETVSMEEGCLSVPGIYAQLRRPELITVQARDAKGKLFTLKAEGMLARAIQHENDHLNGILFIDRLSDETREHLVSLYEKKQRMRKKTTV